MNLSTNDTYAFLTAVGCFLATVCFVSLLWRLIRRRPQPLQRPSKARYADAALVAGFIIFFVLRAIALADITNLSERRWVADIHQNHLIGLWIAYACVAALGIFSAICIARNRRYQALLFFTLAAVVAFGPLPWIKNVAITPNNALQRDYHWFVNTLYPAHIKLNGQDLAYPGQLPPLPADVKELGEVIPVPLVKLQSPSKDRLDPSTVDAEIPELSRHLVTTQFSTSQAGHITLEVDGQKLLLPNLRFYAPGWVNYVAPSEFEYNRRVQPILAWLIAHPDLTSAGAPSSKAGGKLILYDQLRRLPTAIATPVRHSLHEWTFNQGGPIPIIARLRIVRQIIDLQQVQAPLSRWPNHPLARFDYLRAPYYAADDVLQEYIPDLKPEELEQILLHIMNLPHLPPTPGMVLGSLPLGPGNYKDAFLRDQQSPDRGNPGELAYETLVLWLSNGKNSYMKLQKLQETLTPKLIKRRALPMLALLSGPQAAAYFENSLSSFNPPSKTLGIYEIPFIMGAGMSDDEGKKFRKDHAQKIFNALVQLTSVNDSLSSPNAQAWFLRALGPAPTPDEPDTHEPVRELYLQWLLKNYGEFQTAQPKQSALAIGPSILAWKMCETRPEPYLQLLQQARQFFPDRTWAQIHQDLQNALGNDNTPTGISLPTLDAWAPNRLRTQRAHARLRMPYEARYRLLEQITRAVVAKPEEYGLGKAGPPPQSFLDITSYGLLDGPRMETDPYLRAMKLAAIQDQQWLNRLFANTTLDDQAKARELAFAISTGILSPPSITTLARHPQPFARSAAVDLAVRWPTKENQILLANLTADPNPSVSAYAASGERFVQWLILSNFQPIPLAWGPDAIGFFDLARFQK